VSRESRKKINKNRLTSFFEEGASSMARKLLPMVFAMVCLAVCGSYWLPQVQAELPYYGPKDLFYNYYVAPGAGMVGAELYLCPRPVPPLTGHTYITYPPLMPHEFLYKHHRTYRTQHEEAPPTVTRVRWR
jgi:hypothetical protein